MRAAKTWTAALILFGLAAVVRSAGAEDAPPATPYKHPEVEAPKTPEFWTKDELARIDRGLEVLNLDRKDLGFQKRPIDDPFRLPVVNKILDDPLAIGTEAEAWDRVARTGDPVTLLRSAEAALPSPARQDSLRASEAFDAPMLPASVRQKIESILWAESAIAVEIGRRWKAFDEAADLPSPHAPWLAPDAVGRKAFLSQVETPRLSPPGTDMKDDEFLRVVQAARGSLVPKRSQALLELVASLVGELKSPEHVDIAITGQIRIDTRQGAVVLAGTGDDVHDEPDDVILVIDFGGNDVWKRGASARWKSGESSHGNRLVSVCIDLGGDDHYVGHQDVSFGAALGGVAIQWDCGGNDVYEGGHCSCGAGILGVGVLVDEGGDDVYRCKDFGLGAGAFGIGVLLDKAGNDSYHDDLYGEGFASTWGCGVLVDLDGNDNYDAGGVHSDAPLHRDRTQSLSQGFSIGMRPDASGGVGVLVDVKGNDHYSADIYGQGASYWFSLGLLIDDDGNDTYTLGHYGQGAGIHLSCGMLLDRAGQDLYFDEYGVGIGGAHDFAVGFLVDRGGDDHYVGSGGSQGGALTNSVAMLIDDGGNDEYTAARPGASHGASAPARDTGGIGLLLDAGGKDVYSEYDKDGRIWTSGLLGAGLDDPTPPDAPTADPMGAEITPEAAKAVVDREGRGSGPYGLAFYDDLDRLWEIAKRWQVGDERVIGPIARARLVALGKPALDRAIERLGSKDGLEIECCQAILQAMPRETVVPRLLEATTSRDVPTRKTATRLLGTLKVAEAESRLVELLADDDVRRFALGALGALGKAPPAVVDYLRSAKELDGVAAAVCLGSAAKDGPFQGPNPGFSGPGRPAPEEQLIDALVRALSPTTPFLVRVAAEGQLARIGEAAVPALSKAATDAATVRERRSALRALGATKTPRATPAVQSALGSSDAWIRVQARLAAEQLIRDLPKEQTADLAAALEASKAKETDPVARRLR